MGVSRKVKEDDEFIYLTRYLHDEPDEFPDWLCSDDGVLCPDPKWPQFIVWADHYAAYELRLDYRISKKDGSVTYDNIR